MSHTMIDTIFAIDVSDKNTYLIDRINKHLSIYDGRSFLISCTESSHVEDIMQTANVRLIPYGSKFSLAAQKNRASEQSNSPYLLLSDPDFFSYSNMYNQLERLLDASRTINRPAFFFFPALYANDEWSNAIFNSSQHKFDNTITSFILTALNEKIQDNCSFIAPYSNVILLSRNLFQYIGGYNENFKCFGSEDFEFFIRAFIALDIKPLPCNLNLDLYQPATKHFLRAGKKFTGFRNLLSLYSASISDMGYNIVHLHHRKFTNEWYAKKDNKRIEFNKQVIPYLKDNTLILNLDWLEHKKTAICVITDVKKWRPFLTLRVNGYKTVRSIVESPDKEDIKDLCLIHGTKNVAFLKEFCSSNHLFIEQLKNDGYCVLEVDDSDLYKIGVTSFCIDEDSYSCAQCGFSRYGYFTSLCNISYDLFYRIKIYLKTMSMLYRHNIK